MKNSTRQSYIAAAFLMATSAIGPGFLTQTAVFTKELMASFGFVILLTIILDIIAQLNIWRIIVASEKRAQDIANEVLPGLGYLLALLILFGGLAFNIGNVAGAGLGLNILVGTDVQTGAILSCLLAIGIFVVKEASKAMDMFTKTLGLLMILLTVYVAWKSEPPLGDAIVETILPKKIDFNAVLTLVGGTVGGYITFAGAHRLLDSGIKGPEYVKEVGRSAISAVGLASIMRIVLFLAALGVISNGGILDDGNPAASVFKIASGQLGYKIFGIVLWSAAITSVVGAAYTSITFIKGFHPILEKNARLLTIIFILISTVTFVFIGKPIQVLILAGALNGLILPLALAILLIAAYKTNIIGKNYKHPIWMTALGILVVVLMSYIGFQSIIFWTS